MLQGALCNLLQGALQGRRAAGWPRLLLWGAAAAAAQEAGAHTVLLCVACKCLECIGSTDELLLTDAADASSAGSGGFARAAACLPLMQQLAGGADSVEDTVLHYLRRRVRPMSHWPF